MIEVLVLTVSDEVASGADTDRGGLLAVELLAEHGLIAHREVVGDAVPAIEAAIQAAVARGVRVVLASGGTGIGPRDLTSGVVARLIGVELPGIGEEIRRRGAAHTPRALISREIAGLILTEGAPVLLAAIPGSRGGVRDALAVIGALIPYLLDQADGAGHV